MDRVARNTSDRPVNIVRKIVMFLVSIELRPPHTRVRAAQEALTGNTDEVDLEVGKSAAVPVLCMFWAVPILENISTASTISLIEHIFS